MEGKGSIDVSSPSSNGEKRRREREEMMTCFATDSIRERKKETVAFSTQKVNNVIVNALFSVLVNASDSKKGYRYSNKIH